MGYQVYEDSKTGRWAGYGVPALIVPPGTRRTNE